MYKMLRNLWNKDHDLSWFCHILINQSTTCVRFLGYLFSGEHHVHVKWHWPLTCVSQDVWMTVSGWRQQSNRAGPREICTEAAGKEIKQNEVKRNNAVECFVFCCTGVEALFTWLRQMGGAIGLSAGPGLVCLAVIQWSHNMTPHPRPHPVTTLNDFPSLLFQIVVHSFCCMANNKG